MDSEFNKIMTIRNPNIILNKFGTDTPTACGNKEHFLNYKKKITYTFNKHGYRDEEWPSDLTNVIWCVGDSATMGIGQPFDEVWTQILQKKIGRRCLNISSEGCSNDTIRLRAEFIYKKFKPKNMIIMWSFVSRRRVNDKDVPYNEKDFGDRSDLLNFLHNFEIVNKIPINIIHSIVPNGCLNDRIKYCIDKKTKNSIVHFKLLDHARDYFHFDVKTSKYFVDRILDTLSKYIV